MSATDELRARTLAAMQRGADAGELAWCPENLRPLANAFVIGFGREPLRKERGFWIGALGDMVELGITAENIGDAMHEMRESGLFIKSPASVMAIADELHRNSKPKEKSYTEGWLRDFVDH